MLHKRVLIDIDKTVELDDNKEVVNIIEKFTDSIEEEDYSVLNREIAKKLENLIGQAKNHSEIVKGRGFSRRRSPAVYVHLGIKDDVFILYDMHVKGGGEDDLYKALIEIEVFASDEKTIEEETKSLADLCMKTFGLTKELKEIVLSSNSLIESVSEDLKNELNMREPISHNLYKKLTDKTDRKILIELRKNAPLLETDIGNISFGTVSKEEIKNTLDYFSGEEFSLVSRKKAIVCRSSNEIIFLMDNEEEAEDIKDLECPQCKNKIGDEKIISYYGRSDKLDDLLNGNRWMPLYVKEKFVNNGVNEENVLTEVKYEQDELDVLVLFEKNVYVIEVKDRPVNLNDAYKISAKTSRLESIVGDLFADNRGVIRRGDYASTHSRDKLADFVPVIISTEDIAEDAIDLLEETKTSALHLENCESKVESFVSNVTDRVMEKKAKSRLGRLISDNSDDSVSNHIRSLVVESLSDIAK